MRVGSSRHILQNNNTSAQKMANKDEDAGLEIEMPMPIIETQKAAYEEGTPNVNDDSGGDETTSSEAEEEEVDLKNSNNNNSLTRSESMKKTAKKVLSSDIAFVIALILLLCIGLAIGLGVALGGQEGGSAAANNNSAEYDAVIVGAGWAGIRAAQTLLDSGITNILVLEANNYIGGRVKSINSDNSINSPTAYNDISNVPLDYGGEWLYSYNEMEDFMLSNGYLDVIEENLYDNFDAYLDSWNAQFYLQSNKGESARLLSNEEANELRVNVWDEYLVFREEELQRDDSQSVGSAAEKFIQQTNMTNSTELQYFNLMLDLGEVDYAADISQLDLKYYRWQHHTMCDMTYMSTSGTGFGNLAATCGESFIDKVRLNAKVTEINYEDIDNTIISYTQDGVDKKVTTRTVLVTVSLGVLKANTINFVPTLPEWKLEVIDKTGFGAMNKIMMQWDNNDALVWPYEQTWFELITPDDESSGRWTTFFNPTQFKGGVPTLVGWVGGDEAWEMEEQTDEQVLDDAMVNLRAIFPTISNPDRVVVTRWGKEENILGTYSYKVVGRDWGNDSNELGRKVGSIRFAGEATAGMWSDTTLGAWQTGQIAAEDIVQALTSAE